MLIRAPHDWPHPLVAVVAMVLLALLDLGGALAAKEAVARRSPALVALGVVLFVALFWVYASSLQYADLAPVTLGWVVLLQVGVLLLDRFRYDVSLPVGKWVAVMVILAAQAYLLLGSHGSARPDAQASAASAATTLTEQLATSRELALAGAVGHAGQSPLFAPTAHRTTTPPMVPVMVGPRHRANW